MMTCNSYASKKALKACVGEKMRYEETSFFGPQFVSSGINYFARRPHLCIPKGGREFFCNVRTKDGIIMEVN